MNHTNTPPADDDLDRLFTRFFRRAMPHPWPTLAPPASAGPTVGFGRSALYRGRVALAASVAALVVGGWLARGRVPLAPPGPGVSIDTGSAKVPKDLRPKARPERGQP